MSTEFQSLASVIGLSPPPTEARQPHPRPWRKGSVFDVGGQFRRPVDGNDRAKIMAAAESLERRTKAKGKRDGAIGVSGLLILRALLYHFMDSKSGRCDPSYVQIQAKTGLCTQTIACGLKALATAGLLEITRRIERVREHVKNALTGGWHWMTRVVQRTNAYQVNFPVPDRPLHGDLALPLLAKSLGIPSDSRFQRESTSRFIKHPSSAPARSKKEAFEETSLAKTLASLGKAMAVAAKKEA
jgi:hypothetical protein